MFFDFSPPPPPLFSPHFDAFSLPPARERLMSIRALFFAALFGATLIDFS